MSRNYQLPREVGNQQAYSSSHIPASVLPVPLDDSNGKLWGSAASDQTLGLVQRLFLGEVERPHTVVFAGVNHGNGCSQIAASVAESLSCTASGEVCLVEGNFRSPSLSKVFETTNHHGFTDALKEQSGIRSFATPIRGNGLWLLSSGPVASESPSLLASESTRARFAEMRREFDFVIVDAPPLAQYSDAIALGKLSDGLVLILEAGSTRREVARIAIENVRASRVQVLGAVLNKRTFPIPERIYRKL